MEAVKITTIINKNDLLYAKRVLFTSGGVVILVKLGLRNFFESRFSLYK